MKFKNKLLKFFIFFLFIVPINTLAYSNYIIPGGETIGIEVRSKGVLVIGFYKIDGEYIAKDAGFHLNDIITKVNGEEVSDIASMVKKIEECGSNTVKFNVLRNQANKEINFTLRESDEQVLKTGLYVKDKINGVGTLSYIDVKSDNNKIFGSLGHEIIDSSTASKFEIKDGEIYEARVSDIIKSRDGNAGEKNANYDREKVYGTIDNNDITGIYGSYTGDTSNRDTMEVAESDTITTGAASIRTVIKDSKVEEFAINIIGLDDNSRTKNILFEITDKRLLEATGGIVQGMSGSPIIQNNKIVGAVNYVIVNDPTKGYGIFITTMLKEGEK